VKNNRKETPSEWVYAMVVDQASDRLRPRGVVQTLEVIANAVGIAKNAVAKGR